MLTKTLLCSALASLVLGACWPGAGATGPGTITRRPAAANPVRLGHLNQWMSMRRCLERRSLWRSSSAPTAR